MISATAPDFQGFPYLFSRFVGSSDLSLIFVGRVEVAVSHLVEYWVMCGAPGRGYTQYLLLGP